MTRMLLCLLWAGGISAGLYKVAAYSYTSRESFPQPGQWPSDARVTRALDRPTLLLTLHPHCVCSRATLEELMRLLAQIPTQISVEILLYQPDPAPPSWTQTDLVIQARSIPNVVVLPDRKGVESERFGMTVSGHTVLYSSEGRLLFSGGITRARGHAGDNAGREAIIDILSKRPPATSRTPVFGCSILDRS